MKKWIKFLKDYDSHKAGEVIDIETATADVLVKAQIAEATEEPKEVAQKATELTGSLKTFVETTVAAGIEGAVATLVKELKPETKGDKRPRITVGTDREDEDPNFGFKSLGEQARMIRKWCIPEQRDEVVGEDRVKRMLARATKAPSTYANEGVGADGGFLIGPTFSNEVLQHTFAAESLFSRTDTYTTGSNNLTVPKDETTPWGTSGVQVYWTAEAAQATQSKPKLGQDNLILQKLTALVPVTDEQLADSFVGLGQYITRQAGERIMWKVDDAIVNGTGAGQPLGFINSGALVSQAAESAQTAATVNLTNIAKMLSRIPGASINSLAWLMHPSVFPQIVILTNGNNSLYVAPGGAQNADRTLGSLFGIPVIISQHCQVVGTTGDIFLVDLSKYLTLTKGDGIQTAMSMHLFFDYNVSTFRFNFRVAGQPWLQAAISSANGTYSLSPYVSLAAR